MNKNVVACAFPGQGSQRKGMGGDLFDRYPELCAIADALLGISLREICLENPKGALRHTATTQPALFVVNALEWLARSEDGPEEKPEPAFLAGHSLGEYNALFAAGCFDFETGLRLVRKRGALMSEVKEGGMAAVLGLKAERVEEVLREEGLREETGEGAQVAIANFNLPTQLVLSGPKAALEALLEPMEKAGARKCLLLNVSGAFHSHSMALVAAEFETFLRRFTFSPPKIPVIANTTARPYPLACPSDSEATEAITQHLVRQIHSSVRWSETMDYLRAQGVEQLEELGPGTVLTKLWKASEATPASDPVVPKAAQKASDRPPKLGSPAFRQAYGLRSAYIAGSSMPGTRGAPFVQASRKAGLLSFLDLPAPKDLAGALDRIGPDAGVSFGICVRRESPREESTVDLALERGVQCLEAVGYEVPTPALLRFRFEGTAVPRLLMAQVSSLRSAKRFLESPTEGQNGDRGAGSRFPIASDLCVVPDSTGSGDLATLLPAVRRLADEAQRSLDGPPLRVGAGGALGTPEAIASAFLLGADFVQTSAVNLSCSEAALPAETRLRLASLAPGETTSAPAAHGFALGARATVVKKGSLFAPRAQKLYEIFRFYDSLEDIPPALRTKLKTKFFKCPLAEVWESLRQRLPEEFKSPDPKQKMALVFIEYLHQTLRWTLEGNPDEAAQAHIPCDEALPAFNHRVAGAGVADPSARTLAAVAEWLMEEARGFLDKRIRALET